MVNPFRQLTNVLPQKYERYLPTAFDESMTILEKVNKTIHILDEVIDYNNNVSNFMDVLTVEQNEKIKLVRDDFEVLKVWLEGEGLELNTVKVLDGWFDNGKLAQIINNEVFDMKANQSDLDVTNQQLAEIVINVNSFHKQVPEINDTGRLQRALDSLKQTGGKLLFPDGEYYISSQLTYVFEKDLRIILTGGTNATIKSENLSNLIHISSDSQIGDVEIYNLGIDGIEGGTAWDTNTRSQAITVINCRTVIVHFNKIKNVYGMGIFCLKNLTVDVSKNVLLNVRGYNIVADNYGDGIYIGDSTSIIKINRNIIINDLSSTQRCGRIGITLEFDVANAEIEGNYIFGYNRGIHSELTLGGHTIKNNIIKGCFVPFVSITEKGFSETLVENNVFSNKGFLGYGNTLLFKEHFLLVGASEVGHSPKLKIVNNHFEVLNDGGFTNSLGLIDSVSINRDDVVFKGNKVFVDSTVKGKDFFFGSRKNVDICKNDLINVGKITMWYVKKCKFMDNDVSCSELVTDRANIRIERNTIKPQDGLTVLGGILKNRPTGTFKNNTIEGYGQSIDNGEYGVNDTYMEFSNNSFIRKSVATPLLPTIKTSNPEVTDVLYTREPNFIIDETDSSNNRELNFYYSHRTDDRRKIIQATSPPHNRTWKKGDIVYNIETNRGAYVGWVCVVGGTPGTWEPIGVIGQTKIANKAESLAVDVPALRTDFNDLLSRLKNAGLM